MCRQCKADAKDYEEVYADFWQSIVENPDGSLDKDKVMRELHDYHHLLDQLPKVYSHITGGRMSKHLYWAHDVIEQADEESDRQANQFAAEILQFIEDEPEEGAREAVATAVEAFGLQAEMQEAQEVREAIEQYAAQREAARPCIEEDPED